MTRHGRAKDSQRRDLQANVMFINYLRFPKSDLRRQAAELDEGLGNSTIPEKYLYLKKCGDMLWDLL
jgi:hypothetical protein